MDDSALKAVLSFAINLAREAGEKIVEGSSRRLSMQSGFEEKINSVDLVTETDQAVESYVRAAISSAFPSHKFIGEESYSGGDIQSITDDPTWIVDPIDGTTNFVHMFPQSCISIGWCYRGQPTIGVIYNPFLKQLYHGLAGHGAYLVNFDEKTHKLPLSGPSPLPLKGLGQALIGVEWGSDRSKEVMEKKTRSFHRLAGDPSQVPGGAMVHSIRSQGSAALNYAAVACGQLDLYWEIGCWSWDVCAGIVLVNEAGGATYGSKNGPLDGVITPTMLQGRKYLTVRAIGDTPEEKGMEANRRIAREFYDTVEEWDAA